MSFSALDAARLLARDIDRHGEPSAGATARDKTSECIADHRDSWVVVQHHCTRRYHSRIRKWVETKSAYSGIKCKRCGRYWRTKAKYAETLPMQEKGKS